MLTYSRKQYIIALTIVGVIIFLVNKFSQSNEDFVCAKYNAFKGLEIKGIVKKKLIDKNDHNNRIVIYVDSQNDVKRINLSFDASNLFDDLNLGDSLFKKTNSAEVQVNSRIFKIDYSVKCE